MLGSTAAKERPMIALAAFGGIVGVFALLALSSIWKGYVLTVLWSWFVVPTFGAPLLTIAPAIGLAMVVGFLTHQSDATKTPEGDSSERFMRAVAHALVMPLLVLGIGWVVRQFM
jgi:putative Mn2+ efflux pump MntP